MGAAWVDDRLYLHPKAVAAGAEAMGLWVLALSYCQHHRTSGLVSLEVCARLVGDRAQAARAAQALVAAELWEGAEGGFQFHDWQEHQGSAKTTVSAQRRRKSAPPPPPPGPHTPSLPGFEPPPPPPKAAEPPEPPKPERVTLEDVATVLRETAPERSAVGTSYEWAREHCIAVNKLVSRYPARAAWQSLAAYLEAGGRSRMGSVGVSWLASKDAGSAMVEAREWEKKGRPSTDGGRKRRDEPVAAHAPGTLANYDNVDDRDIMKLFGGKAA